MKYQIISEKGSWEFEADKIFSGEHVITGQKDGNNVAFVSIENVFAVIPQNE